MFGLIKALKFDISSIMCEITDTLSKSMYAIMRSDMIGESSSCNFHVPMIERRINVVACVPHHQEKHKYLFEHVFYHEQGPKTKHVLIFVVLRTIT